MDEKTIANYQWYVTGPQCSTGLSHFYGLKHSYPYGNVIMENLSLEDQKFLESQVYLSHGDLCKAIAALLSHGDKQNSVQVKMESPREWSTRSAAGWGERDYYSDKACVLYLSDGKRVPLAHIPTECSAWFPWPNYRGHEEEPCNILVKGYSNHKDQASLLFLDEGLKQNGIYDQYPVLQDFVQTLKEYTLSRKLYENSVPSSIIETLTEQVKQQHLGETAASLVTTPTTVEPQPMEEKPTGNVLILANYVPRNGSVAANAK